MAPVRLAIALLLVLFAACNGGSDTEPDSGFGDPPAGWTCEPGAYGDGVVFHCACGGGDPDCGPRRFTSSCVNNQICAPAGTCSDCGDGQIDSGEQCDPGLPATVDCGP